MQDLAEFWIAMDLYEFSVKKISSDQVSSLDINSHTLGGNAVLGGLVITV